jgi:hypothetical protein
MAVRATLSGSNALGGITFPNNQSIDGDGQNVQSVTVPAAEDGVLTTRTNDTVGTVTMDQSDHTIQTGDRVDLYWTGGQRRGVVVGTVTAVSVPISGGAGDNLPLAASDISVAPTVELDMNVEGDNVITALAYLVGGGQVVFADIEASETEIAVWFLGTGRTKTWDNQDGDDNPFTGSVIGRVWLSQKSATASTGNVGLLYNNVDGP